MIAYARNFKFSMRVAPNNKGSKISRSENNGCYGYPMTSSQSAKIMEKNLKLYNFEELSPE